MKVDRLPLLLARARGHIAPLAMSLDDPHPPFVLFFSVSDGKTRAKVVTTSGGDFSTAWRKGVQQLRNAKKIAWLRVDWVVDVESVDWEELRGRLSDTKRNYFRQGISLDPSFRHAFLETELNANAMLYDGDVEHAVVSESNFLRYALRRHGIKNVDFAGHQRLQLFSTKAAFVEVGEMVVHDIAGQDLDKGRRTIDNLGLDDVEQLISRGSKYLAGQVMASGRFIYGWHPCFDREIETYNGLRHASTLYSMLEAWEVTRDPKLGEAIERALSYLIKELLVDVEVGSDTLTFLVDEGSEIKLGASAVCLLALVKYSEIHKSEAYLQVLERLALGILHMQDDAGKFRHVLTHPSLATKEEFRIIYYDGEAAFGLMRLYGLTKDPRWLEAVERAFAYFIEAGHENAHDHWLSYCVNELTLYRPKEEYYRFGIRNVAGHLDFVLHRITTYPTLLELMAAAERMVARLERSEFRHLLSGLDLEKFYRAYSFRARYLVNGHFWPELAMYFANPARVVGSFFIRHHAFRVRIDDVEHYLSGFVAYRKYLTLQAAAASSVGNERTTKPMTEFEIRQVADRTSRHPVRLPPE